VIVTRSAALVFTRGDESVRVVFTEHAKRFRIVVQGPRSGGATYNFEDRSLYLDWQRKLEARFIEAGWVPIAVNRRITPDRRRTTRPGERRRAASGE
jgi:hypothetical protein